MTLQKQKDYYNWPGEPRRWSDQGHGRGFGEEGKHVKPNKKAVKWWDREKELDHYI